MTIPEVKMGRKNWNEMPPSLVQAPSGATNQLRLDHFNRDWPARFRILDARTVSGNFRRRCPLLRHYTAPNDNGDPTTRGRNS
jgi:hypothetical protein